MTAITDLSWNQLEEVFIELGLADGFIKDESTVGAYKLNLSINKLLSLSDVKTDRQNGGVIKFTSKLLEACRIAQERVNQNQVVGERLAAFPAPTVGGTVNNLAAVTRSLTSRHDLGSATRIVGPNN